MDGLYDVICRDTFTLRFQIHLLVFFPLLAMPGDVQVDDRVPRRLRGDGQSKDVFACVKMQMSDGHLSQPPLNVWPQSLLPTTANFWGRLNNTTHSVQQALESERSDELEKLQKAMARDFPHLNRAVAYYGQLLDASRPRKPFEPFKFVGAGPSAADRIPNVQLGEPAPPPKPHHLQVVFHHA